MRCATCGREMLTGGCPECNACVVYKATDGLMQHYDQDGEPVSLGKLWLIEPEWAASRIAALEAELKALRPYAQHLPGCLTPLDGRACECGYSEARK